MKQYLNNITEENSFLDKRIRKKNISYTFKSSCFFSWQWREKNKNINSLFFRRTAKEFLSQRNILTSL